MNDQFNNADGADPSIGSSITQANRKFVRIFGAPTDPANIYNYTISTFGGNCDPVTANATLRVVDTPDISLSAIPGNDPNPTGVCNLSPMDDIIFDISTFATYTVTWTGVSAQPPGIILVRTNSSTVRLVSDPVVNIPGAIPAGGVSFHHGLTWHGSGVNNSSHHRRALVAHCIPSNSKFHPTNVGGTAKIYKKYKKCNKQSGRI